MQAKRSGTAAATRTAGQRLIDDLQAAVDRQPGLGECLNLFDVLQMEHVCELVVEEFKGRALGAAPSLEPGLRVLLIAPLSRFLDTLKSKPITHRTAQSPVKLSGGVPMARGPTQGLIGTAESVLLRIERGPWDAESGRKAAEDLERAWCKWAAYVSSVWMWSNMRGVIAARDVRRETGRLGGQKAAATKRRNTALGNDKKSQVLKRLAEPHPFKERHEVAGAIAQAVGVSAAYVRRIRKELELADQKANL